MVYLKTQTNKPVLQIPQFKYVCNNTHLHCFIFPQLGFSRFLPVGIFFWSHRRIDEAFKYAHTHTQLFHTLEIVSIVCISTDARNPLNADEWSPQHSLKLACKRVRVMSREVFARKVIDYYSVRYFSIFSKKCERNVELQEYFRQNFLYRSRDYTITNIFVSDPNKNCRYVRYFGRILTVFLVPSSETTKPVQYRNNATRIDHTHRGSI